MGVGRGSQSSLHPSIAAVLSSGPLPMERTKNVLQDVLSSHERLTRLLLSIVSREGTFHYRERSWGTWYKLARVYFF